MRRPRDSLLDVTLTVAWGILVNCSRMFLPEAGNKLHLEDVTMNAEHDFGELVSVALRNELGSTRQTIKTIMRWTGASERTAKNWLAATHGPSGEHLVRLARHSDEIFELFLLMSDRKPILTSVSLIRLRSHLAQTIERLDRHIV